jgi:GPI-anchor transamidase subunit GAA1
MGEEEACEQSLFTDDVKKCENGIDPVIKGVDKEVKFKTKLFSFYSFVSAFAMPLIFLIGIIWHSLHAKVSILTGRSSPRGWYIDENALDPGNFDMNRDQYPVLTDNNQQASIYKTSFCQALRIEGLRRIDCHHHAAGDVIDHFDIARILPLSSAVSPISESIVLVFPWWTNAGKGNDISQQQMRSSVLHLLRRLSESPWLAKTILIVSPNHNSTSLKDTVDSFVNVYFGSFDLSSGRVFSPFGVGEGLPFSFQNTIVRSLIVVDFLHLLTQDQNDNIRSEIRILPMGSCGSLPNMDLTYASMLVYNRARFMQSTSRYSGRESIIVMHQYRQRVREWSRRIQDVHISNAPEVSRLLRDWLLSFLDLLAFEYSMVIGPYPPHSIALDMGVDALTIQGVFFDSPTQTASTAVHETNECVAEFIEKLEYLVRALSNLHERLHHSTSLYLLPSPYKYVKHEEYLVPNLLLVIPCVLRILLLIFVLIKQANFDAMLKFVALTIAGTFGFSLYLELLTNTTNADTQWFLILGYGTLLCIVSTLLTNPRTTKQEWSDLKHSMHFCACMMCLLVHVSLAFGHVSLSAPSAIIWTTLIAFFRFGKREEKIIAETRLPLKELDVQSSSTLTRYFKVLLQVGVVLVTAPFPVVSPWILTSTTPYILYGYIPLHIMFSMLVLT